MKKITSLILSAFLIFILSDTAYAQNAYELKQGEFYRTFEKKKIVTQTSQLVHSPLMFDKEMKEEFFYQGRAEVFKPLMDLMNQHLDSLAWSIPISGNISDKGLPWLFVGSSEAETAPDATMMMMDDHDKYPPMALYLDKPSKEWRRNFSELMSTRQADYAILIWIGLTEYPKADKGLFKKRVYLGTGYEREIRFLSAIDKPVVVLQLTGVLVDHEGNVVRAGAEGFLHEDSPFWVQALEAGTTIDNNSIQKLFTDDRRDELPGQPLTWKVALENLVRQLTGITGSSIAGR